MFQTLTKYSNLWCTRRSIISKAGVQLLFTATRRVLRVDFVFLVTHIGHKGHYGFTKNTTKFFSVFFEEFSFISSLCHAGLDPASQSEVLIDPGSSPG